MRVVSLLLVAALTAGCTTGPEQPLRSAERESHLQQLIAGKAPGSPVNCVPAHQSQDMSVIDGRTIAFRAGGRTTYVAHLSQGCSALGSGGYALVTRQFGGSGFCRGDIARVADLSRDIEAGSCVVQQIVPYVKAG